MTNVLIGSTGNSYTVSDLRTISENEKSDLNQDASWIASSTGERIKSIALAHSLLVDRRPILFTQLPANDLYVRSAINFLNKEVKDNFGLCAFLSSGSTGVAKIIVHSILNLEKSALKIIELFPEVSGQRFHHLFPANYMAGILNCTILPMLCGSSIYLDDEFNFSSSFSVASKSKEFATTVAWLSPSMLASMNVQALRSQRPFPEWSLILTATGPLKTSVRNEVLDYTGTRIHNTFGTTEALFISAEVEMQDEVDCGTVLKGVTAQISDTAGFRFVTGQGALQIKTDTLARHIFQGSKTLDGSYMFNEVILSQNSYLPTGDLATITNNRIQIEGRSDDIIVLGGLNVSLAMVESAARDFPNIIEVCANAPFGGTIADLCLYYEISAGIEFSERDFHAFLVEKLGMGYSPRRLKQRKLPRTPNGKLDRMQVRLIRD